MILDLSRILDSYISRVSEIDDNELAQCAELLERGLIHFLVEQQMRANSVSPLRLVQ